MFPYFFVLQFSALILIVVLDIWAITDIAKYPYKKRSQKWAWTNVILLFPFGGVFFYFVIGRKLLSKEE